MPLDGVGYEIWQTDNHDYVFAGFTWAMNNGFKKSDYDLKYIGTIHMDGKSIDRILDEIFAVNNGYDRPNGKMMRSLSLSDVVVIKGKPYYCDRSGWSEIPADHW